MRAMVKYGQSLQGYEKGEAQVFCDRLFRAFGHAGYKEAGATLELQVKNPHGKGTKFADLVWKPRVLIEMKSRGEKLEKHVHQAFQYWMHLVPDRPRYVVLCNFDEFWIYDFNTQLDSPVDQVLLSELPDRYTALNFLFLDDPNPLFGNDKVAVTRAAADKVAAVFNALVARGEDRQVAQRFILQCVVAMFAEDFDLLPKDLFAFLLADCAEGQSPYDVIGGLFRQMASKKPAGGGRYKEVRYFNGGLFEVVEPMELTQDEVELLLDSAKEQWSKVAPPIFGTLFQSSMDADQRHALGAHFTHEVDIQKLVLPTIVTPWRAKIADASTLAQLQDLSKEIQGFRVLDPACGSGNFLYVAYRELVRLEMEILAKISEKFGGKEAMDTVAATSLLRAKQFYGIDRDPFAVELAKVTLMIGKRIALAETRASWFQAQQALPFEFEAALPLDNLDANIVEDDALFCEWPAVDAIIGNPPYQSKNKMVSEFGREYVDAVRARFPEVPGRADYCVYWFRRAQDELADGCRAGLVGTNTIRQNYSREGGLDYIVSNGGEITQAVSTQVWSGDAAVHVSIVNWLKGSAPGQKQLFRQIGDRVDSPWQVFELDHINPALSPGADVTKALALTVNKESGACYQGLTHGHAGFLLQPDEATGLLSDAKCAAVVHPYMTGDDLLRAGGPRRFVIDLSHCDDLPSAMSYGAAFGRVRELVMDEIVAKGEQEQKETGSTIGPRQAHAERWWRLWRGRPELVGRLVGLKRYIACARLTKRPVFAFVDAKVRPSDVVQVFPLEDDYSFGVLQSACHWEWFTERCSTLKGDFRYTSNTVFDSFVWPQKPTLARVRKVATAARELRKLRRELLKEDGTSLRKLYQTLEIPGAHPLKEAHARLDEVVRAAYGMKKNEPALEFLFVLNQDVAKREDAMQQVVAPGLPACAKNPNGFITTDSLPL